eukprot:TRINITY_DN830_c1_g3_i1.p1 TRINITY_DN830_c1_g3~~TRINITY_DN830_c1_g3_i1.p1  ORF type:complete len:985 (+),score=272.64 TRINITY_DN830_c1_g3_i1:100-3054(+)
MPISSRQNGASAYGPGSPLNQTPAGRATVPPANPKGQPALAGGSGARFSQRIPLLNALFRGLSPSQRERDAQRWPGSPARTPASPQHAGAPGSPRTPASPALGGLATPVSAFGSKASASPRVGAQHAQSTQRKAATSFGAAGGGSRGSHVSVSADSSVGVSEESPSQGDAHWAGTPLVSRILGTPRHAPSTPLQNPPSGKFAPATPPTSQLAGVATPDASGRRRALSASSSARRPSLHPVAEFNSTPQLLAGLQGSRAELSTASRVEPGGTPLSFTLTPRGFESATPAKSGSPASKADATPLLGRWRQGDGAAALLGSYGSSAGSERSTPVHQPQSFPSSLNATPTPQPARELANPSSCATTPMQPQRLNLFQSSPALGSPAMPAQGSPLAKPQAAARTSQPHAHPSFNTLSGAHAQSPSLLAAAAQRVREEQAKDRKADGSDRKTSTASLLLQATKPAGGYSSSASLPAQARGERDGSGMLVSSQLAEAKQGRRLDGTSVKAAAPPAESRKEGDAQERLPKAKDAAKAAAHPGRTVPPHISNMVCLWTANGQEDQAKYGEAGYMRIRKGMVLGKRYHVISKLGWGEFATVWMCWDQESLKKKISNPTQQFVAVKVSKCGEHVSNAAIEEANLLKYIGKHARGSGSASLATVLNVFNQAGEHGNHVCMVFPVLGQNILCLVEQAHKYRTSIRGVTSSSQCPKRAPEDVAFVKSCLRACLRALHELQRNAIVHTDLKPENVLLTTVSKKARVDMREWQEAVAKVRGTPWEEGRMVSTADVPEEGQLSYIRVSDFGLSSLLDPDAKSYGVGTHARRLHCSTRGVAANPLGVILQTREYRAPEVLLGNKVAPCTDVWSVGCMAFELITGTFLMDPKKDPKKRVKSEEEINTDHLCMMSQLIGKVPSHVATAEGKHVRKYFDPEGRFYQQAKADKHFPPRCLKSELRYFLSDKEAALMASFVVQCLGAYDAASRSTAGELLKHPFLAY